MSLTPPCESFDPDAVAADDRDCLWHHIKPHHLFQSAEQPVIASGDGLVVRDIRGREYLDAASGGVWSVIVGYGRRAIARAVAHQLETLPYYAGVLGTVPAARLARALVDRLPGMDKIFFSNSGSEANEKAFKLVRQAARLGRDRAGKVKILYRDRDYHGTTLATLSATGQAERRRGFEPLCPGFVQVPHPLCYRCPFELSYPGCEMRCATEVERIIESEGPDTVGALIVEPITAGGGIIVPRDEYLPMIERICRRHGLWLIIDEVVCGFGRTGVFWGHQHFGISPDIVTMAKGMAGGYEPLSATAVRPEIFQRFLNDPADPGQRLNYFRDISTYGGCTGPMAAALETLRIIDAEDLVGNSRRMGTYLLDRLRELADMPLVGDVRGRGLFCGVELVADKKTKQPISEALMGRIVAAINARGVLVGRTNARLPGNNTIMNFAPALIVTREQIDQIVDAVKAVLAQRWRD
ncbi:MAG: aminotransferase class III-fold pyridoxal phosphate-dependent enzyme [Deltaproteobacteria bacterium]|nr:aminotransferase class III-fold pyridoxal phosphate-dependent enzyme [Deltaproteobacteria bacterium]